jgi:hypothetical protein
MGWAAPPGGSPSAVSVADQRKETSPNRLDARWPSENIDGRKQRSGVFSPTWRARRASIAVTRRIECWIGSKGGVSGVCWSAQSSFGGFGRRSVRQLRRSTAILGAGRVRSNGTAPSGYLGWLTGQASESSGQEEVYSV